MMARSSYVYGVENEYGELMGVFTVKHEAISALETWNEGRSAYYRIWRRVDGKMVGHIKPETVFEIGERL